MTTSFRCGYIALIGRPNVGKSTLLNHLLGQKISITSRKPQTTRHRILGIKTTDAAQFIFVDTPGMHKPVGKAINRMLNRAALDALTDVDVILFLVEAGDWQEEDELVLERLRAQQAPVILVVNKVDRIADKQQLLPLLQEFSSRHEFAAVLPVSALKSVNLAELEQSISGLLPQADPCYGEDEITDRSQRFLAAEFIREKLFRRLGQELPYGLTVEIERFKQEGQLARIHALIWVEKASQKPIVIGRQGSVLKSVGREARLEMERLFGGKVHLEMWVKVKEGWADDERALRSLGYGDDHE